MCAHLGRDWDAPQSLCTAYLYVKTRGGGLSGIEYPRDAGEVVRMLLSGRWVIHS